MFTMAYGRDRFGIMKWGKNENGLVSADVSTSNFKTRHGLEVGAKKNQVINKLHKYGIRKIPEYLILENLEVYEFVVLKFTGDTLSKITFQGYID